MAPTTSSSSRRSSSKSKHDPLPTSSANEFFKLEDQASSQLTTENIKAESLQLLGQIRTILGANNSGSRKQELKDKLLLSSIKLRRLNRHSNFRNRICRDKLGEARQRVEKHYLSLQNVSNEIAHLRKNIEVCLEFRPSDSDIQLVELDEFYANAPAELRQQELTKSDPHQLQLARLKYELAERKNMLANLQELEGRKSALLSDIRGKEQRLSQIRPKIGTIKRASAPIFDLLGVKSKSIGATMKKTITSTNSIKSFSFYLRPIFANEDFCRELFGCPVVELGCDGKIQLKEKDEMEEVNSDSKNDLLPTPSANEFFKLEDQASGQLTTENIKAESSQLLDQIRTILGANNSGWRENELKDKLLLPSIKLRRLNRHSNFRNRIFRDKLGEARQRVEKHYLSLQNVSNEIAHLRKNIEVCLDFRPSDSDIQLVELDEFYANAPAELRQQELTKSDPHQLQLARLKYELFVRKDLMKKVLEMEGEKKTSAEQIAAIENTLLRVGPRLESLKKIAKPLLDIVGLKSVTLAARNTEMPFRPVFVGVDIFKEIFGEKGLRTAQTAEGQQDIGDRDDMDMVAEEEEDWGIEMEEMEMA